MSEARHTRGPWYPPHLSEDDCKCNCRSVVDEGYAGGICTVHVDNGKLVGEDGGNDAPPLEQAKANGHLIAAAPDLLSALEKAEAALTIAVPMYARDRDEITGDVLPQVRAALARAHGHKAPDATLGVEGDAGDSSAGGK